MTAAMKRRDGSHAVAHVADLVGGQRRLVVPAIDADELVAGLHRGAGLETGSDPVDHAGHVAQARRQLGRVHLEAGHGQPLSQALGIPLEGNIFFQPTQTDFHAKIASEISNHC